MPESPKKLDLKSKSISEEQKEKLRQLFPEVFTEDKIDWDRLQLTLGTDVDMGKERFGLAWRGKAECFKIIPEPSIGTLKPARGESVDWDTTENLFIEGDNLETLKLLQKSYYGKVKMIYIDPPYNTGKEFIYPDKYSESLDTYLAYTGQADAEGKKFSTNTETGGRYHSNWLNMMYPRLFLARNLLRDDGVIFVSIDDNEVHNLREMMNEIFGEENFIDNLIWKKRYGGGAKEKYLVSLHEYILLYAKNIENIGEIFIPTTKESIERYYTEKDENYSLRGPYRTHPLEATKSMEDRKNLVFPVKAPDGTDVWPKRQWLWGPERAQSALEKNELAFLKDKSGNWSVNTKQYLKNEDGTIRSSKAFSIIDNVFTQHGTNEIIELFSDAQTFPFPKPTGLIKPLLNIGLNDDFKGIILDFFSGSCTTAHAILELNKEDGGNRNFIMVQLPEPTGEDSEAFKAGYKTIADIGKERIRRVIKKIKAEQKDAAKQKKLASAGEKSEGNELQDLGFRVFKLDKSNFKVWDGKVPASGKVEKQLEDFIENLHSGGTDEEILYELLLKSGFALTTPVTEKKMAGKKVYSIDKDTLLICLEHNLTKELIIKMAESKPDRVICLDLGFKDNDQLKTNAAEIMRSHGVHDFRTV